MTTVLLFARARELAGAKSVVVEGTTVSDVLKVAGERFGDEFSKLVESCTIMVDDEVIRLDQQDTHSAGNEMAILPPVSGGSGDHNPAEDRGPAEVCGAHDAGSTRRLRVAVLTVSDRASAGTYEDRTGPAIESALAELGRPRAAVSRESEDAVSDAVRSGVIGAAVAGTHSAGLEADRSEPAGADEPVLSAEVVERRIVADDLEAIVLALTEWCDSGEIDLVLTNGGTGLSPRDVTPEATSQVLDVVAPGIAELMRAVGLRSTPLAALSRQVVGRRRNTIVVNLPGSTRGAVESLEAIASILPHACAVARTEVS